MKQGQCNKCKIRWAWESDIRRKETQCPRCGEELHTTTWRSPFRFRPVPAVCVARPPASPALAGME